VGGKSFKSQKKKKRLGEGWGENKVAKKTEIGAEKGQIKKSWMAHEWKRETYQCTVHPRWCWFTLALFCLFLIPLYKAEWRGDLFRLILVPLYSMQNGGVAFSASF
jgi:hypothetical protein